MMRKNLTTMIRPKLEYVEVIWSLHKNLRKRVVIGKIQRIATKIVPDLEDLT